jgi:hypothetical protein
MNSTGKRIRPAFVAALVSFSMPFAAPSSAQNGGAPGEVREVDDRAILLATLRQSNGNVLEFLSNPELEELTLWETGPADRASPVFTDDDPASMLEAFVQLTPKEVRIPQDLVRYSRLDQDEVYRLTYGRELTTWIAEPIDIGGHMVTATPLAASGSCNHQSVGWGLDWGANLRNSWCNVDATTPYIKARVCVTKGHSIRMQLGYKHFSWSDEFTWPTSKRKDVGLNQYAYVSVDSVNRKRRAQYHYWDPVVEEAWVGGFVIDGNVTVNHCGP